MNHPLKLNWFSTVLLFVLSMSGISGSALASDDIALTVTGNIDRVDGIASRKFTLADLEALESASFTTTTPWTDGPTRFTGVRIDVLLKEVGAGTNVFRAHAADDYYYDVRSVDFEKFPVIIAYMKNGNYMSVRELGPLWIMFPFDDHPVLNTEKNRAAAVWQLLKLDIF